MTRPDEITTPEQFEINAPQFQGRVGEAEFRAASAGYFEAMGIPIRRGRGFEAADGPGPAHVAVISQSLAEAQWPGRDPLGRYIQFGNMDGDPTALRVVGVVGDVRELSPEALPGRVIYVAARQRPRTTSTLLRHRARARPARPGGAGAPDHARSRAGLALRAVDGERRPGQGGRLATLQPVAHRGVRGGGAGAGDARRLRPRRLRRLAAFARDGHPRGAGRRAVVARAAGAGTRGLAHRRRLARRARAGAAGVARRHRHAVRRHGGRPRRARDGRRESCWPPPWPPAICRRAAS